MNSNNLDTVLFRIINLSELRDESTYLKLKQDAQKEILLLEILEQILLFHRCIISFYLYSYKGNKDNSFSFDDFFNKFISSQYIELEQYNNTQILY
jgi:hypothetical protein